MNLTTVWNLLSFWWNSALFPLAYWFQVAYKLTGVKKLLNYFLLLIVLRLPICDKELLIGVKRSSIMLHSWFLQIKLKSCLLKKKKNIFYYSPVVPNTTIKIFINKFIIITLLLMIIKMERTKERKIKLLLNKITIKKV